jgi:uncharacterized membrane protein (UPF0127 family)
VARITLALLLAAAAAWGVACSDGGSSPSELVDVRIGGLTIHAEVANTPAERVPGLGGRDSMARDAGMLFVHIDERPRTFWMRNMRFGLDFVWISAARQVVHLTENVPPPEPGTPDSELETLRPDVAVQYVLEVNAGVVAEAGIAIGDGVSFEPEPPPAGE